MGGVAVILRVVVRPVIVVMVCSAPVAIVNQSPAILKVVNVQRTMIVVLACSASPRLNHGREAVRVMN